MNRPSPRGGRRLRPDTARAARPEVAVPGSGGSAATASQPRFGHRWRTFGPRAFGRRRLGVWANAGVTWASQPVIGTRSRKARHGSAGRAWKEREASDATG
jgi:hypothetical protein